MDIQIKNNSEDFDEPEVGIEEFFQDGSKIAAAIKYRQTKQK